jgi:glutamate racemase
MERAIGIFDSGVGGLTVFAAIRRVLPDESLIYLGDTARVPYGTKSSETVIKYSLQCADFLVERKIKALVVACNTSSAYSLSILREKNDVPVIGVIEPGARKALSVTKSKRIGVIGTAATIGSNAYGRLLKDLDRDVSVVSQACPLFVPLVEEGWLNNDVAKSTAKIYLESFRHENIDTLILGCTHYPLLKPVIAEIIGNNVNLIDSAEAVAEGVKNELAKKGLLNKKTGLSSYQLYVTDLPNRFEKIASDFLGGKIPSVKRVEL